MNMEKRGPLNDGRSRSSGGYVRKSRRTNKEREEKNIQQYKLAIKQLQNENKKNKEKAIKLRPKKDPIGKTWGEDLSCDENWPGPTKEKRLRFFGQNTNGISYKNGYLEWSMTLQQLDEYQADISGMVKDDISLIGR